MTNLKCGIAFDKARISMTIVLWASLSSSCSLDKIDISGKKCPCETSLGYVCDERNGICKTNPPLVDRTGAGECFEIPAQAVWKYPPVVDYFGHQWQTVWKCPNVANVLLYERARAVAENAVAFLETPNDKASFSWFVCYVNGEEYAPGRDVWYYTIGDYALKAETYGWGFVAAGYVTENGANGRAAAPGVPHCP